MHFHYITAGTLQFPFNSKASLTNHGKQLDRSISRLKRGCILYAFQVFHWNTLLRNAQTKRE